MAKFEDLHLVVQDVMEQSMGKKDIAQVDLSNIASLGDYIITSGTNGTNDVIFEKLVDRIGRTVIANRLYKNKFDFLTMDPFEYGYALQKIHVNTFAARENGKYIKGDNATSAELTGQMQFLPTINVSLFANSKAWEFAVTITREQIKTAFRDEASLAAFISAIFTAMDTSVAKSLEEVNRGVLAAYIGELYNAQQEANTAGENKILAVNLNQAYFDETGTTLTPAQAKHDADFERWCTSYFTDTKRMFTNLTTLRNAKGFEKYTPEDEIKFIINGKFADNIKRFMQSDVYHKELVEMPGYREVDYWQGMGNGSISDRMKINAKLITEDATVDLENVVGVMYDPFAIGVTLYERETVAVPLLRSHRTTYYEQCMIGNFIDLSEQGVMFYLGEVANP